MPSALLAATAALTAAGGGTAPAYPGNTIVIARPERLVAASVQRVRLSGRAIWDESPTSDTTTGYSLSLYVQNAAVDDHCEPSYSAQLQKSINLPGLNASTAITGFVMQDDYNVNPQPPSSTLDWSGESVPFAVKLGVPRIVLCAYQRYVIDDVAWYELPLKPQRPSCSFASGSARRGARVAVRCNVSGPIGFRFARAGARARTLRATANGNGRATLRLRGLAAGGWRVTISSNGVALGRRTLRLR